MKVKKGDTVVVRTGKDKGKEGKVLRAFPKKLEVLVEGVNIATKHQKSRHRGQQGQIITKPMPLPLANVALKDPKSGKAVRVGYKTEGEGAKAQKVRIIRKSGEKI